MWIFGTGSIISPVSSSSESELLFLIGLAVVALFSAMSLFVREVGVLWENLVDLKPIFLIILSLIFLLWAVLSMLPTT